MPGEQSVAERDTRHLLFWSSAARESHWVREELRYALKRKGGDDLAAPEILPVVIEGPPPPPPPEERPGGRPAELWRTGPTMRGMGVLPLRSVQAVE
jgi:hypothetical protein